MITANDLPPPVWDLPCSEAFEVVHDECDEVSPWRSILATWLGGGGNSNSLESCHIDARDLCHLICHDILADAAAGVVVVVDDDDDCRY